MSNIRDFSIETIEIMCSRVDEDPGNFFGGAGGFLDGIRNAVCIKRTPGFTEKGNNLKGYFRSVLEKNDIYGEKLISILEDVWYNEELYSGCFKKDRECLGGQNILLSSLIETITPADFLVNFDIIDMYNKIGGTIYSYEYTIEQLNALYKPLIDFLRARGATDVTRIRTIGDLAQLLKDVEDYNKAHPDNPIAMPVPPGIAEQVEQHTEDIKNGIAVDIDGYDQHEDFPQYGSYFGSKACYAVCILAVARYFGFDITMDDLIRNGNVERSGYVNHSRPYFTRRDALHGASPSVYGPAIKEQLARGNAVIISYGGHYVVVTEIKGDGTSKDDIMVMEPITGTEMTLTKSLEVGYNYSHILICEPY